MIDRAASCRTYLTVAFALAVALAGAPAGAVSIVLDDFEVGVGAWHTNDQEAGGERPSDICDIFTVGRRTDGAMEQAALVEFAAAENTWASVTLPVDGPLWAENNVGQLSMWLRGDGSDNTVDLTLRSKLGEERGDTSYIYSLPLDSREWERRSIRLFAFKSADGSSPDAEAIRNAYLLQFVKTGSWPSLSFYVDEIVAEPIPGAVGPPEPPAEQPLSVRVDFAQTKARMLAQVGANLGDDLPPVLDDPAAAAAISRGLAELVPCVVRLRLSDFRDERIHDYDLIRLNRAINWVADTGARALVCLNPARIPAAEGEAPQWDPDFEDVALKVVALRRGGPHLRYYELYDSPLLSGRFASVEELVDGYNALAARILAADPEARVGGPGLASAWDANVRPFLEGAETLHFLSLHLYGAHNVVAETGELFEAAIAGTTSDLPHQLSLEAVRHLAHSLRRPVPELFITAMAMNSARRPGGAAADDRIQAPFGAAWLAAAVLSASPHADKLLNFRLYGPGWGLMDRRGSTGTLYTAAWLLRSYAPRGSTLCRLLRPADDLLVAAVWTPTARNVFVVYGGVGPRSVVIDAWGIGTPVLVRERRLTPDGELNMSQLPNSAAQSIELDGPGICVIQFVGDE